MDNPCRMTVRLKPDATYEKALALPASTGPAEARHTYESALARRRRDVRLNPDATFERTLALIEAAFYRG
jgi:hypothetical protein